METETLQGTGISAAVTLPAERSGGALAVLAYNQELVQFADAKAGNLILINSLFLAAFGRPGGSLPLQVLEISCILSGALAMIASMRVVLAGRGAEAPRKRADVVFFQDIRRRTLAGQYVRDFIDCSDEELARQVLLRTWVVAGIAERKFDAYAVARVATALTAAIWLAGRSLGAVLGS